MGLWSFYFLIKAGLFFGGFFSFHFFANLFFAAGLIFAKSQPRLGWIKNVFAIPIGVALFYWDSPLPPIRNVLPKLGQLKDFSAQYFLELIGRIISWETAGVLIGSFALYYFLSKKIRMSTIVFIAMGCTLLPLQGNHANDYTQRRDGTFLGMPSDSELSDTLQTFFESETTRSGFDGSTNKSKSTFDIIVISVCSLSWDDLKYIKEENNVFFKRFNYVYRDFNSAASYSGPSIIRLLRASKGQQEQKELYAPAISGSILFDHLSDAGFQAQLAMNHDGKFGGLLKEIRNEGGLKASLYDNKTTLPYLKGFDGSQIYDDYSVLSNWWSERLKSPNKPAALFYNTITLHDGNRSPGDRLENSVETYSRRLHKLLGDLDRFYAQIDNSGRQAIIVFIPEHGAAIRRDKKEIVGLREAPSPAVTKVPVGITVIGKRGIPDPKLYEIAEPTSYLAVSEQLSQFVKNPPFNSDSPKLSSYIKNSPSTRFVAENEDLVIMKMGTSYYFRSNDINWTPFDADK
jgi:cellulose synthase operon protein YhjU